ncbi:MAG: flagellar motor protein MotB [Gallionellales bacterium 35-53-114]|jgi:flagellar motor protein MotB|nr:MAG: flagellar motor protein MotB [Gallionellales bacterium 35-53-114]OYZ62964.1 MAG: flagellar motor protein MotB [Gallionellales bacterium 24-53-125]OZB09054.1 MAG: flagellar motor protein MotB [Gallionellales bacterium 39-52-133]HQS59259.1 OmpA family protein [Gallionellaceae bacterium]HQS76172.1 OmpA family protein [Gallionellaceae bacterium]
MFKSISSIVVLCLMSAAVLAQTATPADVQNSDEVEIRETPSLGEAVEKQLPTDIDTVPMAKDVSGFKELLGERIETQKVLEKKVKTIKLQNVVPPILFGSGEAAIPEEYIAKVRSILASMAGRRNVRLHLVGYTDNVQLRGAAKAKYGDNAGLGRERAGVAAEFFQKALDLPPEAISYEGMGENNPVASNATPAGRKLNRRMEVEVWYDEIDEQLVEKQIVISEKVKRVKVCRIEQMCKISYKAGIGRRARIKNLIPPLPYDEDSPGIPADFQQKLLQVMKNLENKQAVSIKFIAYTDNKPLLGRDERIYGTHLGLSKARARRVAQAVQDALKLPANAVDSDGKGATNPLAPNDTEAGRVANRRVEVEFWYDDAMQELSDEPQLCPEDAGAEIVTRVYNPPSGPIKAVLYENSKPVIEDGYAQRLRGIMDDIRDKSKVRLRFIGYTNNERLDRRTALAYGDDIGLSTARARTVMENIRATLGLTAEQVEHEGRGYVQSDDVVNSGFIEADESRVEVQVVYDELAALENQEGLDITRLTREVTIANPYALNLMRITVDGKPLDDPGKSVADVARCVDLELEKADIQFKFDNLNLKPRLNVTAWPNSIRYQDDPSTDYIEDQVRFKSYSNFPHFIVRSEIRIFNPQQSVRDKPLATIVMDSDGTAQWQAYFQEFAAPGRDLKYVLRVYDKDSNFNETSPQTLWVLDSVPPEVQQLDRNKELLAGYGENRLAVENINLNGGTVKVYGSRIPAERMVSVAGRPVPVAASGEFVVEEILPPGLHSVEVAVLDKSGNGELYLRDLELEKSDWFYVGIADVTASKSFVNGPAQLLTADSGHYDNSYALDGRLAFYTSGKFGNNWQLTASADTLEGPVGSLFSNFMQKSPDALFRRIDPDYYYPTYGDDSTTEEGAPTLGKFYVKLKKDEHYGLWGNFKVGYMDNSLAHVDRTLYGANLHFQPSEVTSFGEKRFVLDGFAAQPGTVAGRDEYRGTGGSLYYLRHQDIMSGSERARIEIRDKASGMVVAVKNLTPVLDYSIDYLQGRVLLSAPLSAVASDDLLIVSDLGGGNEAYLVVRYEYSTGFEEVSNLSTGGRTHYWLGDHVKLGVTSNKSSEAGNESSLNAADITFRKSAETWLKVEKSNSAGETSTAFGSNDGGFNFASTSNTATLVAPSGGLYGANRIDTSIGFKEIYEEANGNATFYRQFVEAGYSAPGLTTPTNVEQFGGTARTSLTEKIDVRVKADKKSQDLALETVAVEANLDYKLDENWVLSSGVRNDNRADHSPVVPLTQVQGDRTDVVARAGYDSKGKWSAYGYVQDTVKNTGNRETNGRVGSGGAYQVSERFRVNGEVSNGDFGGAVRIGTEYLYSDKTTAYLNYALENERSDNGVKARKGSLTSGVKSHYSDTTSIYVEEKYAHGDVPTGLTHSTGVEYAPDDRWNFGAHIDNGSLRDNLSGARMDRSAFGASMGYGYEAVKVASAIEYRLDQTQSPLDLSYSDRSNWLTKNSLKYQITPDWRFISKLNYSQSKSSQGEFYDGTYTEAVFGYGYRPVENDRLNTLLKYTYFYNMPSAGQITVANSAAAFIQKSHIFSVDALYDLTRSWTIGGKYAYKLGQVSQDRVNPEFFNSRAQLYIVRLDWHFVHKWDMLIEGRLLSLPDALDSRSGMLFGIYRHLDSYFKLGAGYNFTNFSDDLTDLSYTHHGIFINLVGKI